MQMYNIVHSCTCSTGRSSSAGDNEKGGAAGPSSALDSSSESVDGDQKPPSGLENPATQTMLAQVRTTRVSAAEPV
jgi:hypothetical protein